jgi:uncharacterized membrane protein YfcA
VKTFIKPPEVRRFDMVTRDRIAAVVVGATFGFVVGLTSVGSGTFFGLAMLLLFPLSARRIVGTDLLHASLLLWVAGVGHLLHGNVDLHAMSWLLVGSIPGVLVGSQLSIRVPDRALRVGFSLILVLSGVRLAELPAATTIIEVGVALGLVAFVVWILVSLRDRRQRLEVAAVGD